MDSGTDTLLANYQLLAQYNRWFNERLYAACEQLPEAQRRVDRGAFFGSIHGSLNHILWADRLWLQRFASQGVAGQALKPELVQVPDGAVHATVLHEDWNELRDARAALDAAIEQWLSDMPSGFLEQAMRYANTQGVKREHAVWKAMTHFFNHQTHHRGQVTTLLSQAGVDVGMTDLISLV